VSTRRPVEVDLLDGQRLFGFMAEDQNLSALSELKLVFRDQEISITVSEIRSVACADVLVTVDQPHTPSGTTQTTEVGQFFQVQFTNGQELTGQTRGFLNLGDGGIYLYVRQDDKKFRTLWIPRTSLQSIHIKHAELAIDLPPTEQPNLPDLATNMAELAALLENARGKPLVSAARALFELGLIDEATFLELSVDKTGKLRAFIDAQLAKSGKFKLQLEHVRAHMIKTPEVDVELFQVVPQALEKVSWPAAAQQSVVPLGLIAGTLYLASANPMNRELEARLAMVTNCHVMLVWAGETQIRSRLARENKAQSLATPSSMQVPVTMSLDMATQDLQSLLSAAQNEIQIEGAEVHSTAVDERSSVVRLVKRLITDAYRQKASDIHIETNPDNQLSRVRFRIDGDLEDYLKLPADLRAALVSRIKVMSKLDISERRRPQDGKINFADFSDVKLELRVAILPTHDNLEDVVMRLLASSKPIALAQLGFSQRDADIVSRMAQRPYGLILACGPTGSGKTTTLHSLLSEINTENRKIWTAEDPIEITQVGLRQLQVNPKIGVTFASAMRAFLRADPDVIMIGEVRDKETATIAIEASLTGHLVLSTLHTNNAAESIVRLLDLGMDPMNFADSLIGIVAQRLVRGLCKHCKTPIPLPDSDFEHLVHDYIAGTELDLEEARRRLLNAAKATASTQIKLYRSAGCELCSGKGYKGRTGIYETLGNSPGLKQLIQNRAMTSLIFKLAIASGTRSLKQDALEKVFSGVIDLAQASTLYD
jgi:type II secretory ATPase GspE/PulE/Tfp pilus assembly ATPase PilB-like protein